MRSLGAVGIPRVVWPGLNLHVAVLLDELARGMVGAVWSPEIERHVERPVALGKALDVHQRAVDEKSGHGGLGRHLEQAGADIGRWFAPRRDRVFETLVGQPLAVEGVIVSVAAVSAKVFPLKAKSRGQRGRLLSVETLTALCAQMPLPGITRAVASRLQATRE